MIWQSGFRNLNARWLRTPSSSCWEPKLQTYLANLICRVALLGRLRSAWEPINLETLWEFRNLTNLENREKTWKRWNPAWNCLETFWKLGCSSENFSMAGGGMNNDFH